MSALSALRVYCRPHMPYAPAVKLISSRLLHTRKGIYASRFGELKILHSLVYVDQYMDNDTF